ncbi:MAG: pyroglutamyl-peptidase I [Burkholderiales bacterium]
MRLLVTAFEPFAGDTLNASQEAVQRLPSRIAGAGIVREILPTMFGRALESLAELIERERPTHVVCVGEAGGRAELCVERIAINVDDARLRDNAGRQPVDTPVVAGGPAAYFSTLPIKAMAAAIRAAGLPAAVSNSAGTYVCNHVFYGLLHLAATRYPKLRAGFIHVPCLPAQAAAHAGMPSLSATDTARGLVAALQAVVTVRKDLAVSEGREA